MLKKVQSNLSAFFVLLLLVVSGNVWGQILSDDFSSITTGNSTSTGGSGTTWSGNENFTAVTQAYQAGGAVKLGSGSNVGSLTTKTLNLSQGGGSFTVKFDVKGWSTVEGQIKVTVTGLTAQTVSYTATISDSFETKTLSFTNGTANSTVKIETTAKRAFIDNVIIESSSPAITPAGTLNNFTYAQGNGPSSQQNFTFTASNLTPASGSVTITPPANYEISLSSGTDYVSAPATLTKTYTSGTIASTNVYVRLKSGLNFGSYTGNITLSGGGVTSSPTVAVSGTVTNTAPTATALSITGNLFVGQLLTSHYTYSDNENDPQGTSTFKWYRADNAAGTNRVQITNATAETYTLVAADYNKYITFSVTPAATTGNPTGTETFSAYVGPIDTTVPTISVSGTLSALNTIYGTPSGTTTFTASATNLTEALTIAAPAGYEISTSQTTGFNTTVILPQTNGDVTATTIYVRIAATTGISAYSGNITLNSAGATQRNVATVSSTVTARALTITGLTGSTKIYDGSNTAVVTGTPVLNNIANNETITLSGTAAFNFTLKTVGTGKAITVSGYTLSGLTASNYTLTLPTTLTGDITSRTVTVTGAVASDKVYNGTATATISNTGTLNNAVANDAVSVAATGTFASVNAGTGIGVTLALTGGDAANYTLTQPGITANINKANPVFNTATISVGQNSTYALPGTITTTSNGALSYSLPANNGYATLSGTTISGVAAGSTTLTVNQAASTNYNAATTTYPVNVTTITYVVGDYRTKVNGGGTWTNSSSNIGTVSWQRFGTSGWADVTNEPTGNTDAYTVYITENVTVPNGSAGGFATAKLYVTNNATLTFSNSNLWTFRNVIIDNGATIRLTTRFTVNTGGNFEIYDGGNFIFDQTSSAASANNMVSSLWAGNEIFHPTSNFIIKNHLSGSGNPFLPSGAITSNTYSGVSGYFGNLILDSAEGDLRLGANMSSTTVNLTHGNLEIKPKENTPIFSAAGTWTVGGNLIIGTNSTVSASTTASVTVTTSSVAVNLNVKGNVINSSSNTFRLINNTSGGTTTLNVDGDIILNNNGKLDLSGNGNSTLNLKGDVSVASGALLYTSVSSATTAFNFTGTGNGTTAATTQTVNIATSSATNRNNYLLFTANSGSYVQLTSNLALGTEAKFTVASGSVFNTDTFVVSGPTFASNSGSTIVTANTGGLVGALTATTNTLNAGTSYIFNGATTTPFLSTTTAIANLTTNANVALNRTVTPTGNVTVNSGTLDLDTYNIDRVTSGSTLTVGNGATLKIGGTSTLPANYATHVLNTNSSVHYAGANQTVKKPGVNYYNLQLSGTGAKTFESNIVVGNDLYFDEGPTASLTANQTLTVTNQFTSQADADKFVIEDNAALLQTNNVTNIGNLTVKKNSNSLYRLDYTMWSSPTHGAQTLGNFSPGTTATRFYEYNYGLNSNNQAGEYYFHADSTSTFQTGHAYLIRMPSQDSTPGYAEGTQAIVHYGEFKGIPNNGTVNRTLNIQGNRFTAAGNPYPSPISISEFLNQNSDVLDNVSGIYLWRKRNDGSAGSYATVNLASYTVNTSNGAQNGGQVNSGYFTGSSSDWRIAPGQGFIVKAKSGLTGTPQLTFNNTMRKAAAVSGGQSFFRTAESTASRYWLNLANAEGSTSQLSVVYMEGATTGIDYGYDAEKLGEGSTLSLYTLAQEKGLTIQARPEFDATDVVPAGYTAPQAGTYTISIDHNDGVFANGQKIYIRDNAEGVTRELTDNAYTFTTEAGTFDNRFEVIYNTTTLGTDNPQITANDVIVYKKGATINVSAGQTLINNIRIYDISGRTVYSSGDVNNTEAVVSNLNVAQQILIIEVNTAKGKVSKRIIF